MPIVRNIPQIKKILEAEKEVLEKNSTIWIKVNEKARKILQKGKIKFYFIDVKVDNPSISFVYAKNNPFLVRDGDNLQLNNKYNCYCTFVKSPLEFTLIFEDYVPEIYNGKLSKTDPSRNIIRQINLLDTIQRHRQEGEDILRNKKYNFEINNNNKFQFYSFLLTSQSSQNNMGQFFNNSQENNKNRLKFSEGSLTPAQEKAIERSIKADYFYLIHGPPGTGKTTAISEIVLNLVSQGKSILICSWMNVAVDNILYKIIKSGQVDLDKIARIGAGTYKVSENVQHLLSTNPSKLTPIAQNKIKIVGSTLASALYSTSLISEDFFDVVIVDEAGASTVTQTLLALSLGKKFILVGDYLQLPPVLQVKSEDCGVPQDLIDDFKISMFEKMISRWSSHCIILDTQFRMERIIAEIANLLVYRGIKEIKTGVSNEKNYLPECSKIKGNRLLLSEDAFSELKKFPAREFPVLWMHVEGIQKWERNSSNTYTWSGSAYNIEEVKIVYSLYKYLMENIPQLKNENIGIITTYRKQVEKLNEIFGQQILDGLEISTVDSFQGKEKDIIIFSTVYAHNTRIRNKGKVPNIFNDKRRFNVAFTRAKYKLIVVGDVEIIRTQIKYFQDIFKYIRDVYGDPSNRDKKRGLVNNNELLNCLIKKN